MSNNRSEQEALIQGLAPTVDLVELQAAINTDGYVFKKDVVTSQINPPSTSVTCNFATSDQVTLEFTGNKTISVIGLEDGQTGRLDIIKGSNDTVDFVGVTGTVDGRQIGRNKISYEIISFGGNTIVRQLRGIQESGDLTAEGIQNCSVSSTNYFKYELNNNILTILGEFTLLATVTASAFVFKLVGLDSESDHDLVPISVFSSNKDIYKGYYTNDFGTLKAIRIESFSQINSGDSISVAVSLSFKIKN